MPEYTDWESFKNVIRKAQANGEVLTIQPDGSISHDAGGGGGGVSSVKGTGSTEALDVTELRLPGLIEEVSAGIAALKSIDIVGAADLDPSDYLLAVKSDFWGDILTITREVIGLRAEVNVIISNGRSLVITDGLLNPIFRVDEDGAVHIKTGHAIQADL